MSRLKEETCPGITFTRTLNPATVDRFLRTPFVKKDRIQDAMKSIEKMRGQ